MAQPMYSVSSGAISGAVWEGKFGPQPSIRKAKRNKEGRYEKDEDGKQIYTDFIGKNDLLHYAFVATQLYVFMNNQTVVKTEPEF